MQGSLLETIYFGDLHGHDMVKTDSAPYFMYTCRYLRKAAGIVDFTSVSSAPTPFYACFSLESINVRKLNISTSFQWSARLTAASVAYMVNNAGTAAITITLHATAYARAIADAAVQAALAAKTNVTLASA